MTAVALDQLLAPTPPQAAAGARALDDPVRELRLGAAIAALFFVLFIGWAAVAPMDAAASAAGELQVAGQRQSVQHRDGGIVAALPVREGQKVRAGDILVELAGSEVRAQEQALASQMLNLTVQQRRLEAEAAGAPHVAWPAEFKGIIVSADEIRAAISVQDRELAARRGLLAAQSNVLLQQSAQAYKSASGFGSQMTAMVEQERLIEQELSSLGPVAEKGFVSKSRLRALERARAEIRGQGGRYRASVAEAELEAGASRLRRLEAEKAYRERSTTELKEVTFALAELTPKYFAARDQLQRLRVRAPASGTVVGLNMFTIGGVIAAGQRLMDIVPDRAELVAGARIAPDDADDVVIGQQAELRLTGMHDRGLPILTATMTRLSADVLVDEKTGLGFYQAEFRVPASEIAKIRQLRGADFRLRPGAPVQIVLPLRKRTALQYAFEPLALTIGRSGREH